MEKSVIDKMRTLQEVTNIKQGMLSLITYFTATHLREFVSKTNHKIDLGENIEWDTEVEKYIEDNKLENEQ